MVYNRSQIEALTTSGVLSYSNPSSIRNASYDLETEMIIDMDGKPYEEYKLPPQGMAYVISKEKLNLPKNIIAFAHVKTSITQRGIMATNIGIIDPCYEGSLSTLLINFGNKPLFLTKGRSYLRLTFHIVDDNYTSKKEARVISKEDYIADRKSDTDNLDQKFLNLSAVTNEVFTKVMKYLVGLGIIFSAASFSISMYFQIKTSNEKDLEKALKRFENQTNFLTEQNAQFQTKLEILADSNKKLSKAVKVLNK
jgi:deoxycytidine triphosphate deaminase